MPKDAAKQNPGQREQRRDARAKVRQKNRLMREAWERGRELIEQLGMQAGYREMQAAANDDASLAEKYRKLRGMAHRITERELASVCEACLESERAWGPSFLVELGRLDRVSDRRRVVAQALDERWGLKELQRRVRQAIGPQRESVRVGRKRQVDWSDEAEILLEIQRLAWSWARFHAELTQDATDIDGRAGLAMLTGGVQGRFEEVCRSLADLQGAVERRLRHLGSP